MASRSRLRDLYTGDLFSVVPKAPGTAPGSLNIDTEIRNLLSSVLKRSPDSRPVIAGKMSELLGDEVTFHQLNAWTAEAKEGHRFPVAYLPAFESATGSFELSELLAGKRGGKFLVGEEALEAELGRVGREEQLLKQRKAQLLQMMGKGRR